MALPAGYYGEVCIMAKLGFLVTWINWVMGCITTPSFSILINGKPYGNIRPSKGICQGDPLSLYLFLLCAEDFTSLQAKAEMDRRIKGVSICRGVPTISNLMFADDSILFCRATTGEAQVINEMLQVYANASGQCINMEKSSVYFSSNTRGNHRDEIVSLLGVKEVERFGSYLGLPTLVGRAKYQTFSFLKDRVWKKLQGWKGNMLSKAGKEVLIKAIAQAIPTYTMGVFQLLVKWCDELNSLCAKFWWGQIGNEKKIHWKSWDCLTQPKKEGGMGFRDLRYFNLAMLAKQGWRLLKNHESLMFKCFKARYFPRCNFLHPKDSPNNSFVWKSMVAALPILKSGCCWRVGNGESIEATKDKWIPNYSSNKILHLVHGMEEGWRVSDLIDWDIHGSKRDIIMAHFNREEVEAICRIPLSRRVVEDSVIWLHTKKGEYSVRFGYHLA